ncbi:MAG: SPOR domain-containing protein [Bdellovibrionales bacterium]|nr:SPOR domain-containing protein [Bdellovibrionales bacterium]
MIFFFSSLSFILGWLLAVFIFPGGIFKNEKNITNPPPSKPKLSQKQALNTKLFKDIKENIFLIFDPYKIDTLITKNTLLAQKDSSFNKEKEKNNLKVSQKNSPKKIQTKDSKKRIKKPFTRNQTTFFSTKESARKKAPLIDPLQAGYDEKNKEQLLSIETEQDFFKREGRFSFLINVFSEEKKAFEYIKQMKEKYPLWSFLLKKQEDQIRIYLGPFVSKEQALEFKKILPIPYPFPSLEYLEEVSL